MLIEGAAFSGSREFIGAKLAWLETTGQLLALGRRGDELALYAVDAKTHELEPEPLVSLKGR